MGLERVYAALQRGYRLRAKVTPKGTVVASMTKGDHQKGLGEGTRALEAILLLERDLVTSFSFDMNKSERFDPSVVVEVVGQLHAFLMNEGDFMAWKEGARIVVWLSIEKGMSVRTADGADFWSALRAAFAAEETPYSL